ncbi:MAG: hypothetical protein P1U40_04875 [Coxiellaceae bacterium]|nr:hypothetical protein [Coxiellaceae bacterium]
MRVAETKVDETGKPVENPYLAAANSNNTLRLVESLLAINQQHSTQQLRTAIATLQTLCYIDANQALISFSIEHQPKPNKKDSLNIFAGSSDQQKGVLRAKTIHYGQDNMSFHIDQFSEVEQAYGENGEFIGIINMLNQYTERLVEQLESKSSLAECYLVRGFISRIKIDERGCIAVRLNDALVFLQCPVDIDIMKLLTQFIKKSSAAKQLIIEYNDSTDIQMQVFKQALDFFRPLFGRTCQLKRALPIQQLSRHIILQLLRPKGSSYELNSWKLLATHLTKPTTIVENNNSSVEVSFAVRHSGPIIGHYEHLMHWMLGDYFSHNTKVKSDTEYECVMTFPKMEFYCFEKIVEHAQQEIKHEYSDDLMTHISHYGFEGDRSIDGMRPIVFVTEHAAKHAETLMNQQLHLKGESIIRRDAYAIMCSTECCNQLQALSFQQHFPGRTYAFMRTDGEHTVHPFIDDATPHPGVAQRRKSLRQRYKPPFHISADQGVVRTVDRVAQHDPEEKLHYAKKRSAQILAAGVTPPVFDHVNSTALKVGFIFMPAPVCTVIPYLMRDPDQQDVNGLESKQVQCDSAVLFNPTGGEFIASYHSPGTYSRGRRFKLTQRSADNDLQQQLALSPPGLFPSIDHAINVLQAEAHEGRQSHTEVLARFRMTVLPAIKIMAVSDRLIDRLMALYTHGILLTALKGKYGASYDGSEIPLVIYNSTSHVSALTDYSDQQQRLDLDYARQQCKIVYDYYRQEVGVVQQMDRLQMLWLLSLSRHNDKKMLDFLLRLPVSYKKYSSAAISHWQHFLLQGHLDIAFELAHRVGWSSDDASLPWQPGVLSIHNENIIQLICRLGGDRHVAWMLAFIERGECFESERNAKDNAIIYACRFDHPQLTKALLDAGAYANHITDAYTGNWLRVCQLALIYGGDEFVAINLFKKLFLCHKSHHFKGATSDSDARSVALTACLFQRHKILRFLQRYLEVARWDPKCLLWAVKDNDIVTAEFLLVNGIKTYRHNERREKPLLYFAIAQGFFEISELLMNHNYNVNIQSYDASVPYVKGKVSAFYRAVALQHMPTVTFLLNKAFTRIRFSLKGVKGGIVGAVISSVHQSPSDQQFYLRLFELILDKVDSISSKHQAQIFEILLCDNKLGHEDVCCLLQMLLASGKLDPNLEITQGVFFKTMVSPMSLAIKYQSHWDKPVFEMIQHILIENGAYRVVSGVTQRVNTPTLFSPAGLIGDEGREHAVGVADALPLPTNPCLNDQNFLRH